MSEVKHMFLRDTDLVKELDRAIDAYLTSYSYYNKALSTDSRDKAKLLIDLAGMQAARFGERSGCVECRMMLETAYDALKKAIEEGEELEDDFIAWVEKQVQEALIAFIIKKIREKCGEKHG